MKNFFLRVLVLNLCSFVITLDLGDICTIKETGHSGTCRLLDRCQSALNELQQKKWPQICGFQRDNPIVCCDEETETTGTNISYLLQTPQSSTIDRSRGISEQKCVEYSRLVPQNNFGCTTKHESATRNATPEEFPHMALVGYDTFAGKYWFCSGSLISELYVLTSRDCLYWEQYGYPKFVRLGGNLNDSIVDQFQVINITELIKYPDHLSRSSDNNIALLKLASPAKFNQFVRPVCLPAQKRTQGPIFANHWPLYFDDYLKVDNVLRRLALSETTSSTCKDAYGTLKATSEEYICVAHPGLLKADNCQPKGQLLIDHPTLPCMHTVIGLLTEVGICTNASVTAYTDVSKYVSWIEKVVWRSN